MNPDAVSAVPNRADPGGDPELPLDVALPHYVAKEEDGLWVDFGLFSESSVFCDWVDRLFAHGIHLRGIDYPAFCRLAYDFEPGAMLDEIRACEAAHRPARLRFAAGLSTIIGTRVGLYRGVKIDDEHAEYLFEPVTIDFTINQPVYETTEDGEQRLLRTESVVVAQKTHLDFDEFVAQMWLKGVRYGLDEAAVRKAIADDFAGRMTIARSVPARPGKDAGVAEVAEGMRRDDSPRLMPDGRVNLARFHARFPQVRSGTRLLRKEPREFGMPGRDVGGQLLAPAVPHDIDFGALAGPGTRLENDAGGEYLTATLDGFLDIDNDSSKVSVTESVVHRAGVSLRTTGDISLMGEGYEEHGEVQERRTVEGFNITAFADVFGRLVSNGGTIRIAKNLSGGTVLNQGGQIVVEGRASGATILAPGCEVDVRDAEASVIVARRVVVGGRAVGCDIQADEVEIARADGCSIGATKVVIAAAGQRGQNETLISMLLPALAEREAAIAAAHARRGELDQADTDAQGETDALRRRSDVVNYLAIAARIRRGETVLTDAQKPSFQRLAVAAAPALKELAQHAERAKARAAERAALDAQVTESEAACTAMSASVSCRIDTVTGEVLVRALPPRPDATPLASLPPAEIKAFLRATPPGSELLFSGSSGQFEWRLAPPADGVSEETQ